MEIDPIELVSKTNEAKEAIKSKQQWLNAAVAVTVSLLATFMGICKVKDDNVVQAMQQAQADKLDHWNFYQARNLREEVAKSTVTTLQLMALSANKSQAPQFKAQIEHYENLAKEQHDKKEALKSQAEDDQKTYDSLNFIDDQFDLADAAIAIAISLLAVASLTELTWMYFLALIPSGFGFLMGLSGLLGWGLHPDILVKLLS
jgi:Domain of unknown function (DUF4337)